MMCSAALRGCNAVLDNDGWLGKFFETFGLRLAAWVGLLMVGVHWLRARNERMRDKSMEKAGDLDRIVSERNRYHDLLIKCQVERSEWMRRAITAEATLQGYGELRQIRAIAEATKRLPPAEGNGE